MKIAKMGHLEKVLPQMTHPPEFAFRIIALSLVVDRRTLFLAVMVLVIYLVILAVIMLLGAP